MKVLLDENVDYDFKFLLPQHDARHVDDLDWKGLTNGKLLDAAEADGFKVIVTVDRNFQHQQDIVKRNLCLIVLEVHPKNLANLAACSADLLELLDKTEAGQTYVVKGPSQDR